MKRFLILLWSLLACSFESKAAQNAEEIFIDYLIGLEEPLEYSTATDLQLSISDTHSMIEIEVTWPNEFTDHVDLFSTTNLMHGQWELLLTGITTAGSSNYFWTDLDSTIYPQRYYLAGNGELDTDLDHLPDAHELLLFTTDPSIADVDGDGIGDGDELFSDGSYGDTDGFTTDPFTPDTAQFSLPTPQVFGPSDLVTDFPTPFIVPPSGAPAPSNTPAIAQWTRINAPGDTMIITGEFLSDTDYGRDSRFLFFGQTAGSRVLVDGEIQRLEGRLSAVTLPEKLPSDEMYLLWPHNIHGWGLPVAINKTEAWWAGPSRVIPGEPFSIYGRNLTLGNDECRLYIDGYGWLISNRANPYKADFIWPNDLTSGSYTGYAHNGHGAEYGWSQALTVEVQPLPEWSETTLNVKEAPYHAAGDGTTDDYFAISGALNDCPQGGTVYFPEGIYAIGQKIDRIKSNTRLLGAGSDRSIITTHATYSESGDYGMIHAKFDHNEIRDIGFESGAYNVGKNIRSRSSVDSRFINCRFSDLEVPLDGADLDFVSSHNLLFENCTIITYSGENFGGCNDIYFNHCDFRGWGDDMTGFMLTIGGSRNISITDCTAQHHDNSDYTDGWGWCQGRFVLIDGNQGVTRNVYIGNNTTYDMAPRWNWDNGWYEDQTHQNAGEQILSEHQRTTYHGAVLNGTFNTIQCTNLTRDLSSQMLTVVSGKGLGQSRLIESVNTNNGTVTVSAEWQVIPDESSSISIGKYISKLAVFNNRLDGPAHVALPVDESNNTAPYEPGTFPVYTASAGVSIQGGCSDAVVVSNTITEVTTGISFWSLANALDEDISVAEPSYFIHIADNAIQTCQQALSGNTFSESTDPLEQDIAILGTVWRKNRASEISDLVISATSSDPKLQIAACIYDQNQANSFSNSNHETAGIYAQVWIKNSFEGNNSGTGMSMAENNTPVLRKNDWEHFSAAYGGKLPGGILELPIRVVDAVAAHQTIPIRNSGTAPMFWIALEASPWISLTNGPGTVAKEIIPDQSLSASIGIEANETTEDHLYLNIDTSRATNQAAIVILTTNQIKVITVIAHRTGEVDSLYNTPDGLTTAQQISNWMDSELDQETLSTGIAPLHPHGIPNRICWENKSDLAEWQAFFDRWNRVMQCDIWTIWQTYWNDPENQNKCDQRFWHDFWRDPAHTAARACWPDADTFWRVGRQVKRCNCWKDWNTSDDWNSFRSFWESSPNRAKCICWHDWNHWPEWDAYWSAPTNWAGVNNWDEWKSSWKQHLTEERIEKLSTLVEEWLTGSWVPTPDQTTPAP